MGLQANTKDHYQGGNKGKRISKRIASIPSNLISNRWWMMGCYIYGYGGRYSGGKGATGQQGGPLLGGKRGQKDGCLYSFNFARFGVKWMDDG